MSVQQISSLLKTMSPQFHGENAIKVTPSQLAMMTEVVDEFCLTHEAPQLHGILARIKRRMKQANHPHLWHTEYDLFANSMIEALKEHDSCRLDDTLKDLDEIFKRENNNSMPGHNRHDDKPALFKIFS